jgi:hypothetical protein
MNKLIGHTLRALKIKLMKFLLGCLLSFGLIQRMYDGCLDRRIFISWLRLILNCVPACEHFEVTFLRGGRGTLTLSHRQWAFLAAQFAFRKTMLGDWIGRCYHCLWSTKKMQNENHTEETVTSFRSRYRRSLFLSINPLAEYVTSPA